MLVIISKISNSNRELADLGHFLPCLSHSYQKYWKCFCFRSDDINGFSNPTLSLCHYFFPSRNMFLGQNPPYLWWQCHYKICIVIILLFSNYIDVSSIQLSNSTKFVLLKLVLYFLCGSLTEQKSSCWGNTLIFLSIHMDLPLAGRFHLNIGY